jgi:hypothetical protein
MAGLPETAVACCVGGRCRPRVARALTVFRARVEMVDAVAVERPAAVRRIAWGVRIRLQTPILRQRGRPSAKSNDSHEDQRDLC